MAKGKVEIRAESCKSCGYCVMYCPKKVLAVGEKVNAKGYQYVVAANPEECIGRGFMRRWYVRKQLIEVYREV